jgi:hypothetical protein
MSDICFVDGGDDGSPRLVAEDDRCKCGGELELEYGFCKHGIGVFMRCKECGEVYDFCEDNG